MTSKARCVVCDRPNGQFKCEGCSQSYCINHVVDHRQTLNQQLNEIILEHDVLQQKTYDIKNQCKSLLTSIEQWEQKSIDKIRQMSKEARQKVAQLVGTHEKQTTFHEFKTVTQQIKTARQDEDFFEKDLRYWKTILEKVKHQLKTVSLSNEIKEDKTIPFIYPIQIVPTILKKTPLYSDINDEHNYYQIVVDTINLDERFDRCYGNAKIERNGCLVTNGNDSFFGTEIRGRMEYSVDIHKIRLQIENNPSNTWIFIGIISKGTRMGGNLFTSSSVYGWGDYDDYFIAGQRQKTSGDVFFIQTRENDIIELTIDCTKKTIRYTIERSHKSQEITIDTKKCPLPWQLYISLGGRGDQISLLNTSISV